MFGEDESFIQNGSLEFWKEQTTLKIWGTIGWMILLKCMLE